MQDSESLSINASDTSISRSKQLESALLSIMYDSLVKPVVLLNTQNTQ